MSSKETKSLKLQAAAILLSGPFLLSQNLMWDFLHHFFNVTESYMFVIQSWMMFSFVTFSICLTEEFNMVAIFLRDRPKLLRIR